MIEALVQFNVSSDVSFEFMQGSGGTPETREKATPDWRATSLGGLVEQHKQAAAAASKA